MPLFKPQLLTHHKVVDWGYTEELEPYSYDNLQAWVEKGEHGSLGYLADHRMQVRSSLKNIFPECESALVFLFSYHQEKLALEEFYKGPDSHGIKLASYVLGFEGKDYHVKVRESLEELAAKLSDGYDDLKWRLSLDIQPVLERDLAHRAGLGWFGKNSMLISKDKGSFFIIGSLLLNKKLEVPKRPIETDHCGQCRACVDACPTQAIDGDGRTLTAEKCISTWTIEHFKEGPDAPVGMEKASGEVFGCDICQDVCPWNHRPVRLGLEAQDTKIFEKNNSLLIEEILKKNLTELSADLEEVSNRGFVKKFLKTPLERTGRRGLLKNLYFWKKP
jgi:epoxyqueuosine reductase